MSFLKSQKTVALVALLVLIVLSSFKFVRDGEVIGLHHPESVYPYDGYIYVSNIGSSPVSPNKDGFITKLDKYGNILEFKFIEGLEAPKGIYPYKGNLYIADLTRVCVANLTKGTRKCINIKGAKFLNDIIVIHNAIYVTDTVNNCVYKIDKNEKAKVFFYYNGLSPNGITFSKKLNAFIVVSFDKPIINIINLKGKLIHRYYLKGLTGFDGVSIYKGNIFLSDFRTGQIVKTHAPFNSYKIVKRLGTPAADILVKNGKIYLPLIEKGKLIIGRLQ